MQHLKQNILVIVGAVYGPFGQGQMPLLTAHLIQYRIATVETRTGKLFKQLKFKHRKHGRSLLGKRLLTPKYIIVNDPSFGRQAQSPSRQFSSTSYPQR